MKKINPLHTLDMVMRHMLSTGEYFPQERCTGRSTALALEFVAKAIRNPHEWVVITDHHDSAPSNNLLASTCRDIIAALGLRHFQFRSNMICFGSDR